MPHDLSRIIAAVAGRPWAIEPMRGEEILAALALRHEHGPRAEPFLDQPRPEEPQASRRGRVAVLNLMGTIAPRASAVRDASAAFTSLERFGAAFDQLADDGKVSAIVLNVDSPGGMVDLVPEVAAKFRGARREGRPIHAVANTMAASAAYWIASQADKLFASPSAIVGSIGVRAAHMDQSQYMQKLGVKVTQISAGARKTEGNPYEPLDAAAKRALQEEIDSAYSMFVADVAKARGVAEAVVRADPEKAESHMGGGRSYGAARALQLGMVDGVATLDEVLSRLSGGASASLQRERLALD